jgi:hypothetical protein
VYVLRQNCRAAGWRWDSWAMLSVITLLTDSWAMLSRYQNAAAASREYAGDLEKDTILGHVSYFINLIQRRNRQDRTQNFRKQ